MRLLVIGGSGLLGYKTTKLAVENHEAFFTYNYRRARIKEATGIRLDKCDRTATLNVIKKVKPEIVIDTAALHSVEYCETHPTEARKVNVGGTRNIADGCKQVDAKMIFLSTDYVFNGKKGYYSEDDVPNPLNYYAKTKLEAEKMVKNVGIPYIIARPSVIYGWNPSEIAGLKSSSGKSMNFVIWTLGKLRNGEEIKVVTDQYSSPTLADNLAEVLLVMASSSEEGVYHTAGKSCINRYDFTLKIAETFDLNKDLIKSVTSDVFKQVAERPKRCCLNVSKAEETFNVKFLRVEEGLSLMDSQEEEVG